MKQLTGLLSRTNVISAVSSVIETFAAPMLLLVVTPLLLKELGADSFGRLSFVTAISGLGLIANAGMGAAALHYIARHRAANRMAEAERVFQTALFMCLACVLVFSLLVLSGGLLLSAFSDSVKESLSRYGLDLISVAFLYLLLQQLDWYYSWSLKGLQRFGAVALVELTTRLLTFGGALWIAAVSASVLSVALFYTAGLALSIAIKQRIIARCFGPNASALRPSRDCLYEIFSYGRWTWLHSISAAMFGYADRLFIAVVLSPADLARYAICLQLGQVVHALPAAGFQFLFPLLSRLEGRDAASEARDLTHHAIALNWGLSFLVIGTLLVLLPNILQHWISADFANANTAIAATLVVAFGFNSLHVASFYALVGQGRVKYVSLLMLFSSALAGSLMPLLLDIYGIQGAAMARVVYSVFLLHYVWSALFGRTAKNG